MAFKGNDRMVEVTVQPCKFCGSLNVRFSRNRFGGTMFSECECGAIVSFKMLDQSPRAFFEKWNSGAHKAEVKAVQ